MNSLASIVYEVTIKEEIKVSYKGLTGGWSKWGGRRMSVIESQNMVLPDVWVCQSCSTNQPKDLSPYKYEYPEGEYLRVCAVCIANGCQILMDKLRQGY